MLSIVSNITDINFDDIKKKSLIIYNYDILIYKENECIPLIKKYICKNYKSYKFYSYNFDHGLLSVSSKKTPVNNDYFPSTANSILEPVQMQSDSNNKPQTSNGLLILYPNKTAQLAAQKGTKQNRIIPKRPNDEGNFFLIKIICIIISSFYFLKNKVMTAIYAQIFAKVLMI